MKKIIVSALAAVTLAGGMAVAGEASAQRYGGGYYDRGHYDRGGRNYRRNDDGAAIALGVLAGAALLGNGNVYVNQGYYGPRRGYGYYDRPYYGRRCWTESFWDPYYGRVNRRVCR